MQGSDRPTPISIDTGKVQGAYRTDAAGGRVIEYRGIPFADSPSGDLRWELPKTKTAWTGTFDASDFGPACPQVKRFNLTDASNNEDCLSINITAPADLKQGEKLPVLFWIHGGAFVGGSSNLYRLDKLANQGRMVVVTANYRLGFLGFVPLPALANNPVNGNFGIEDQREAMRWVQRNISKFGGDPKNITVSGESAGAASVCMHLASPDQVNGLFHKAIIMSAGCLAHIKSVDEAISTSGTEISNNLDCPNNGKQLACLRNKPIEQILAVQTKYANANATDLAIFAPVYGTANSTPPRPNATIPTSIADALSQTKGGKFLPVPTLIGGEQKEILLYVGYWWQAGQTGALPVNTTTVLSSWLPNFYGKKANAVAVKYGFKKNLSDTASAEKLGVALSDYNDSIGINNCLYYKTADTIQAYPGAKPLYVFEFADPNALVNGVGISTPYPNFSMGPVHSAIINYVFPGYSNNSKINAPALPADSELLSEQIVQYWSKFVSSGNPASSNLPSWPTYAKNTKSIMKFAPNQVGLFNGHNAHHCEFWKSQYPKNL